MTTKPLQTKTDYEAALKAVSALVHADPCRGTAEGNRLEALGAVIEACEATETDVTTCDSGVSMTFSDKIF